MVDVAGCHAESEIGNLVGGIGDVPGEMMLDNRNFLRDASKRWRRSHRSLPDRLSPIRR